MLGLTAFISLLLFDMVSFFTAYTAPLSKFHCVHLTVCIAYLSSLLLLPSSLTSELLAHFNHTKKQWPFILS